MKCSTHTDIDAVAFCRSCGKALCGDCRRLADGSVFCAEHAPAPQASPVAAQAASQPIVQPGAPSPGLAFVLGLIPGVGAIYNSQYVKGLVHVIVLGTLISLVDSNIVGNLEPLFGMLIGLWVFYMAFEAYHTANRRLHGQRLERRREFPDFVFPQQQADQQGLAPEGWTPTFADYLYVSITAATAFSPTDAMPYSRSAKLLMGSESTISIAILAMLVARAVNIAKG